MLRADLLRTRATSIVLIGLIAMAALLAAIGGGVLTQLTRSIDRLFVDARTPDLVQMHAGPVDLGAVGAWADDHADVTGWQVSETLPVPVDDLYLEGVSEAGSVLQPALATQNRAMDLLLGLDNELLEVGPGEIALPVYYAQQRGSEIGDRVSVRLPGARFDFTVAAFLRDSMMNPTFATSKRLLISADDHAAVAEHIAQPEYLIEFAVEPPDAVAPLSQAYADSGPATNGPRLDRATFYLLNAVSHGIGVAVLGLLALLTVAVAAIALRFAFLTSVERDMHEIGVMKAIGLPERRIRGLYLTKYLAMAVIGGGVGALLSLPAAQAITASLRLQLGEPAPSVWTVLTPVLTAGLVVLAIGGWCALLLRRLRRISVMEALRANAARPTGTGRRRWLRGRFRLADSRFSPGVWMGLNAILRNLRTHRMLLVILTLCTFLILVPLNLWSTVASPTFVSYMGTGIADLRLELRTDAAVSAAPTLLEELETDEEVSALASFVTARFRVRNPDREWEDLVVEMGDHGIFPLPYLSGRSPARLGEIALSTLAAASLRLELGDAFTLQGETRGHDVTLVGIYQDLTNGGRTAKGVLEVEGESIVWRTILANVAEGISPGDVARRLGAAYPAVQTIEMSEFADQTLGELTGQTRTVAVAAAVSAVILAFLIATMFAQLVIARDRSQIAIQRALGVSAPSLRRQYMVRFLTVLISGVVLGVVLVATVGQWLVAVVIGGQLGAPAIRFVVDPLLAYVVVPAALTVTVAFAIVTATGSFAAVGATQLAEE